MTGKMSFGRNQQPVKKTLDADLLELVREYLARNSQKSYISIDDMVDTLQARSFRFARMKKQAFTALVKRAYYRYIEIQETCKGQSNGSSGPMCSNSNPTPSFSMDSELLDKVSSDSDIEIVEPGEQVRKEFASPKAAKVLEPQGDPRIKAREPVLSSPPKEPEIRSQNVSAISEKNSVATEPKILYRPNRGFKRKYEEDSSLDKSASPKPKGRSPKRLKREVPLADVGNFSFDDFAGGEKVIEEICQLLLHLKHPEIYKTLGVTPPRGFLLHGPPGCGKSLLANAIAGELKMPMLKMAATELISGISGESEGNIRDLFRQALDVAPSIIFLDEIDSITPKRETAQREMERRIVAQMLACIDELGQKEKGDAVLLIGATNRLETIDSALRRAGRFDREISIGIPDEKTREKILRVICKNLRLQPDFNFELLAKLTPGYVGADLQALAREAAIHAINAVLNPQISQVEVDTAIESTVVKNQTATEGEVTSGEIVATVESTSSLPATLTTTVTETVTIVSETNNKPEEKTDIEIIVPVESSNAEEKMEVEVEIGKTSQSPTKASSSASPPDEPKSTTISKTEPDVAAAVDSESKSVKPESTEPSLESTQVISLTETEKEKPEEGKEVVSKSDVEPVEETSALTPASTEGQNGNDMEVITIDNDTDEKEGTEESHAEKMDNAESTMDASSNIKSIPPVVNIDEESDDLYDSIESLEDNPDCVIKNSTKGRTGTGTEDDLSVDDNDADVQPKPSIKWIHDMSPLKQDQLSKIFIELKHFQIALKYVQPSSKREGFATVPDTTWDDIGALKEIRDELQVSILGPVKYSQAFQALGINNPAGVLLCGPPGCGKTLLAKAVANEAGINFISVKGPELLNMYVGESERAVRQCFLRAKNSAPCVIFFDELDALCPRRSDGGDGNSTSRVVNQLLTEMDGMESRTGVYIMAATNRPDIIDPAVLRPGRLDKILFVNLPSTADRVDILQTITKNGTKPTLADDVSLVDIAKDEKCNGYTGADMAALVREASVAAFRELVLQPHLSNTKVATGSELKVSKRHFEAAFFKIKPSVSKKDLEKYAAMKEKYSQLTTN